MNTDLPPHLQAMQNMQQNRREHFRQKKEERRKLVRETDYAKLLEQQKNDIENGDWRCCMNCLYWDKTNAKCDKYKAVPPPHIIIHSCPEWEDDIPF